MSTSSTINIQSISLYHTTRILTDPSNDWFQPSDTVIMSCRAQVPSDQQIISTLQLNGQTYITSDSLPFWTFNLPNSDGLYTAIVTVQAMNNSDLTASQSRNIIVKTFTVEVPSDQVINRGESYSIFVTNPDPTAIYSVSGGDLKGSVTPPVTVTPTTHQIYQISGTTHGITANTLCAVSVRSLSISGATITADFPATAIYTNAKFDLNFYVQPIFTASDLQSDIALINVSFGDSDYSAVAYVSDTSYTTVSLTLLAPAVSDTYPLIINAALQSYPGCSDQNTQMITVFMASDGPIISDLSTDVNHICAGQTVNLILSAIGTGLYAQITPDNTTTYSISTTLTYIPVNPKQTTTYTVTLVDMYGQTVSSDITVYVDLPLDAGPNQMILPGQSVILGLGSDQSDVSYVWVPSDDGSISDIYNFPTLAYPQSTTTYTVYATSLLNSDLQAQSSTTITVSQITINSVAIQENVIYPSSTITLIANISTTGSHLVNISVNFNESDYSLPGVSVTSSQTIQVLAPSDIGNYPFVLQVTDTQLSDAMATYSDIVSVIGLPTISAGSDHSIVLGQAVTIGVSPALPNYTYSWVPATGFDTSTTSFPALVTPTATTTYKVTATPVDSTQVNVGTLTSSVTINVYQTAIKHLEISRFSMTAQPIQVTWSVIASPSTQHNASITFNGSTTQYDQVLNWSAILGYGGSTMLAAPTIGGFYPLTLTVWDPVMSDSTDTQSVSIFIGSPCLLAGMTFGSSNNISNFVSNLKK